MSIREALLIGMVVILAAIALVRPKIGLLAYIWYGLMRPDVLAWVEDERNIHSLILFIATAAGSLRYLPRVTALFQAPFNWLVILLQIPLGMSVLFAFQPELCYVRYNMYIKMILALLLIPILIETVEDMRNLVLVFAFSLGFVGMKYGIYGVIHGGVELARGYGPMLADNNFVALALAMVIPFAWYAFQLAPYPYRLLGLVIAGASISGIVMTNSRGGSLAMGLGLLYIALRSKHKIAVLAIVVACLAGSVYLVQDMYIERMSTLTEYEEESSAMSRIHHLRAALQMWKDYPILGVGFGGTNYAVLSRNYSQDVTGRHVVHNSYAQMLVDSGLIAFLLYTGALFLSIWWAGRSAKRLRALKSPYEVIPRAIQSALLVFALGSAFYSCQRMDLPYMLILMTGAWYPIEKQLVAAQLARVATPGFSQFPVSAAPAETAPAAGPSLGLADTAMPKQFARFRDLRTLGRP